MQPKNQFERGLEAYSAGLEIVRRGKKVIENTVQPLSSTGRAEALSFIAPVLEEAGFSKEAETVLQKTLA